MINKNLFKIIVPSFNNEDWVEYNIASILNQTYSNYKVLYISDASTDDTYNKVNDIVGQLDNWDVIENSHNKGAQYNYFEYLNDFVDDNDILIHLDGDDWFYDENVLDKLNNFYNKNDCWMTYGGFVCWDGTDNITLPNPQSTPYPDYIHDYKLYRRDIWRASHLRTFRGFLIKAVDNSDLKSNINQKYYWHAADLAHQFPCLEMCPKDKIGVVDFYAHVYNESQQNSIRTQEREDSSNNKFELEIRNKKVYKEGITGEKLHQVNVFGSPSSAELCSIPSNFSYCYNVGDGEYDLVLFNDLDIEKYIDGQIKVPKNVPIVARLLEQRDYFQGRLMNKVKDNYKLFHTILTFDKILLDNLPNAKFCNAEGITAFTVFPNSMNIPAYHSKITGTFKVSDTIKMFPKTKYDRAVCITSAKAFLPGHNVRLNFVNNSKDKIDLFGKGIKEVESKLDVLHNYAFCLAIENNVSRDDYYFTEKLLECIITGTIPIYYGCPNISEFFDTRGIITFETQEELDSILNSLNEDKYKSMLKYAKANFDKAIQSYVLDNDSLYNLHLKKIIEDGITV